MITEEMILKKFNGDEEKAARFVKAFIISQDYANNEIEKMFDTRGEIMKSIAREFDEYVSFLELSLWKRILIKVGLMKKSAIK